MMTLNIQHEVDTLLGELLRLVYNEKGTGLGPTRQDPFVVTNITARLPRVSVKIIKLLYTDFSLLAVVVT